MIGGRINVANDVDNSRLRKNLQPRTGKQRCPRLFPAPKRTPVQLHSQPNSFWIGAVSENPGEMARNIFTQIICALRSGLCVFHLRQKRKRVIPGRSYLPEVFLVQLLQQTRFPMAVEILANLQSKNFERARGRGRARTMRADDENR